MQTNFRKSTIADLPAILNLIRQAQQYFKLQGIDQWQNGYPNEQSIRQDIEGSHSYLLEEDGIVTASAALYFTPEPTYARIYEGEWHTGDNYAAIHRVAVDNAKKGSGTAAVLYQGLENECKMHNIRFLRGDTHRDNVPMQKFMQKMGFTYCGIIYLGDGAERLAFDKTIHLQ